MACGFLTFVDDERIFGPNQGLTWQAGRVLAAKQAYLGIIDAARKARECTPWAGAWAGSVVHVVPELGVCALTSEDKWIRMKRILEKWDQRLNQGETLLPHSELESDRGFLVYVTRTYPPMIPYLKGFHLALEMWRGGRDSEGWKLKSEGDAPDEEEDEDSVMSASTIDSLDFTRGAAQGLSIEASNAPDSVEEVALNRKLKKKDGTPSNSRGPPDGLTPTVPRLAQDIKALMV